MFIGATINNVVPMEISSSDGMVTFTGTYNPVEIGTGGDKTILYIGSDNKLYYPNTQMTIGCQRAYFTLNYGLVAGDTVNDIHTFMLNFDGVPTGISYNTQHPTPNDRFYTVDGRLINDVITQKGVYINNGRKVVIK